MNELFFEKPIINSPYQPPKQRWQLDENRQPTHEIRPGRRPVSFITPIPNPRNNNTGAPQRALDITQQQGIATEEQQYDLNSRINEIRTQVERWRNLQNPKDWKVTPETQRLLQHWRNYQFQDIKPFFCQLEAVETIIWLTEVAPKLGQDGRRFLNHLQNVNREANPQLIRWALKMATGSGKTTVMAMIITWQNINAIRRPRSNKFTSGFLVVAPGITIRDRLRVLIPNDPDSYYSTRQLVPKDMLPTMQQAIVVVTNYHAFMLREKLKLSKTTKSLVQGRETIIDGRETEGQMIRRVMPQMMGMKNIMVLNDEGHHCYREKPGQNEEQKLDREEATEAKKNNEAARLWISGLEIINRKLGIQRVIDLSATPFFLRGSGYAEGTLFPWTVSDFSLMDAIECGIVKLPRVPVADNIPGNEMPTYRYLWNYIRKDMPRAGRAKSTNLDPRNIPPQLETALTALYGHYEKTYNQWKQNRIPVPPCFIIVCNNTATSKLVYEFISGAKIESDDNKPTLWQGKFPLFQNFDEQGNRIPRPPTLLIDSQQLESGDALDPNFRKIAAHEIEEFRRQRFANQQADDISDQDLLREVVNTVGKQGKLGEAIRCVVSVAMLSEGWDTNTVTHILGIRAFGTQLLCEQVVGRALRRHSYDLNEKGLFDVEYADVLGVPFDFNAKPVVAPPKPPKPVTHIRAITPERDNLEIVFPRVNGYRVELPKDQISANLTEDSILELTPDLIGPAITRNEGIIGKGIDLNLVHTNKLRTATLEFNLTQHLLMRKWREPGKAPDLHLFGPLKHIVKQWIRECLICKGGTYPAQLMMLSIADMACERIAAAITRSHVGDKPVKAMLDPFNPSDSTKHVNFNSSKPTYRTDPRKCQINYVVQDSGWEAELCRAVESHPKVNAYAKNQGLGLEVPYAQGPENRTYIPDFIIKLDDGNGEQNTLNLIVEIKGYRREDAKAKKDAIETYWIPGVNNLREYGRWTFAEFKDPHNIQTQLHKLINTLTNHQTLT